MSTLTNSIHGTVMVADTLDEMVKKVNETGSYFFTDETMEFFRTTALELIGGVVVVGMDENCPTDLMLYWARVFAPDGDWYNVAHADTHDKIVRRAQEYIDRM